MCSEQQECDSVDYENLDDLEEELIMPDKDEQVKDNVETTIQPRNPRFVVLVDRYEVNDTRMVLYKVEETVDRIFLLLLLILCVVLGLYCWTVFFDNLLPSIRNWIEE